MKRNIISKLLASVAMLGLTVACSSEDDGLVSNANNTAKQEMTQTSGDVTTFDQVAFLQGNIIEVDTLGNIRHRIVGSMQNPADTTELSVHVEDIDAATKKFMSWLSPDTQVESSSPSTVNLRADLKDRSGSMKVSVSFKAAEDDGDKIAEVTFDKKDVLKHFTKIVFRKQDGSGKKLLTANSNGGYSPYNVGEIGQFENVWGSLVNFVCIKEATEDEAGLMVYISPYLCKGAIRQIEQYANPGLAFVASSILTKDWDHYVTFFKNAGMTLDKDEYYWVNDYTYWLVTLTNHAIRLSDGDFDWFLSAQKHYLKIETFGLIK